MVARADQPARLPRGLMALVGQQSLGLKMTLTFSVNVVGSAVGADLANTKSALLVLSTFLPLIRRHIEPYE